MLVTIQDLTLAFSGRVIFDRLSLIIGPKDRIGIVGKNGAGKSSLMKILAGVMPADGGQVILARSARAGYLPQDLSAASDSGLLQWVLASVPDRSRLEQRLEATQADLLRAQSEEEQIELSGTLADVSSELAQFEQHYGAHRAAEILQGLGFKGEQFTQPLVAFSGGWRMRAALAGLLLQDPELLLLDEPTNHLDVETLAWFDDFLETSQKALVLISHDRVFLNKHIRRVLALQNGKARSYTGNYDSYQAQRTIEADQQEAQAVASEQKRAQLQNYIDRFGAKASKAKQAQSKQKQLAKLEPVEREAKQKNLRFRFPQVLQPGREVLRINGLCKSFASLNIYRAASATVMRGERIAIFGPNGTGKTTLLKLVAGELAADAGQVTLGHNVVLAYYAQHHADKLDLGKTVFAELDALVPDKPPQYVRQVAGAFLFSGDDIDKPIRVLSGGERARVALAKLLLVPSNFLLLDEPTNHLDLDSSEALIEALSDYPGTILFVSHNESFIQKLATRIWQVGDGQIAPYAGDYQSFIERLRAQYQSGGQETASAKTSQAKARRQLEAKKREQIATQRRPLKQKIEALEKQIANSERAQKEDETRLADPAFYSTAQAAQTVREFSERQKQLAVLYEDWEKAQAALAQLEDV